jgi:hypothetical protein
MRQLKNIFKVALVGFAMLQLSCEKDEITAFSAPDAVNFTTLKTDYSFLGNATNEYVLTAPVRILGNVSDKDRKFNVEVVNDENTTATAAQYSIIGGVVKAGSYTGDLSIKVLNSTDLNTKTASLKVKLVDSEDFKAGNLETSTFIGTWTNQIVLPTTVTYYRAYFCSQLSFKAYSIIVQLTGLKTLTAAEYRVIGAAGMEALGTKFGDYVKQWNLDHPNDKLKHDSGTLIGQEIVPIYYTKSKYN